MQVCKKKLNGQRNFDFISIKNIHKCFLKNETP